VSQLVAPRPDPRRRGIQASPLLRPPLAAAGLALAATALVAAVDPGVPGRYPVCPSLALTGLYCPLCGGLRAVHALTRLDVAASIAWNAIAIPLILLAVWFWIVWIRRAWRGETAPGRWRPIVPRWAVWVVCLVGLAFGVARNLPGGEFLAPHA
jgi:hypothetical protein